MRKTALIITLLIFTLGSKAQDIKFRENIDKDSLLNASIKNLPKEQREEYIKTYKEGNKQTQEFLLFMISMPESSKKELIQNFENKKTDIEKIKNDYEKLVPKNHIVEIEFEPESKILTIAEQITIKIYKVTDNSDRLESVSQNWNLKPDSKELKDVLKTLDWTNETLTEIRLLLKNGNCISVENGKITTIGFARSGMGLYSYKLFEKPLDNKQKEEYNNGCEYIFYKDNIVLQYGGGAVGPQCFEKE